MSDDALRGNVRSAVAAELTTLPTYLYPYWSIRPLWDGGSEAGQRAKQNLMAVILEEMLHMGLSSNLLNALGGRPLFTEAPYLPTFPGHLMRTESNPTGWGPMVDLLPLSEPLLDMIIEIELPTWDDPSDPIATLGGFYDELVVKLLPTDDAAYQGGRQLALWDNPGAGQLIDVASHTTAVAAIGEIKDQGEGANQSDHQDRDDELAHYWRFEQIKHDAELNLTTDVYPIVPSPRAHVDAYTPEQSKANDAFNQVYSRMLDALQQVLSGDHPDVYPKATGLMSQLQHQADVLRATGEIPGTSFLPGPTFDYVAETNRS